jgi:hypothetical protein
MQQGTAAIGRRAIRRASRPRAMGVVARGSLIQIRIQPACEPNISNRLHLRLEIAFNFLKTKVHDEF